MSAKKTIIAADLFCGAGGTSTGLAQACQKMGFDLDLLAVNHWDLAISTHTKNHPEARHICGAIDTIRPEEVFPGGRINLLVASPECTHFSNARGNKPMNNQKRATAWDILNWLQKLYVDNVLIENVKEFKTWGPLGANGRPLKSKRGSMFEAFLAAIRALGYNVEHRVLNAADYGDPTTRERLFIIARRNNRKIIWPEPTHAQISKSDMFQGAKQKWRSAREIIDWSIESKSIFTRKKPLAPATLRRIEAGLRKFGGPNAEPFIVILRRHADAQSIDEPIPTVTGSGSHHALCEPFIMPLNHGEGDHRSYSVEEPMKAITSVDAWSLIEPFVIGQQSGSIPRSVDDPVPTVSTDGAIALVQPFIVPQFSENGPKSVDQPLGAITTTSRGVGLCEPFIIPFKSENGDQTPRTHSIDDPLFTVASGGNGALIEPYLVQLNGQSKALSAEDPLPTVTGMRKTGLVEPYLIRACHGEHDLGAWPIDEPIRTITGKDQFALIQPGEYAIDIRFRMLQPHELSAAMGFPKGYEFTGNRESVVKQIGNAVPTNLAEALCTSLLKAA